jgi:peptidoglycan-associated lipoprotein
MNKFSTPSLAGLYAITVALVMAGCASKVKLEEPKSAVPVENRTAGNAANRAANGRGAAQSSVATVDLSSNANQDTAGRVIYFDFDSYVVKDEGRVVVDKQARRLVADPKTRVVVEGHTDERGGREYNLALGQRRAESVVKALTLLGARENQLEAVSFGMERPAATGSTEEAWAKNRRAEVKDR